MASISPSPVLSYDVEQVRRDFPVLQRLVHGKPLVYLDTAASAQRPLAVIEAVDRFYRRYNANIHRGVHSLSQEATEAYENARRSMAEFINAPDPRQVIFTRGTTESINLVAQSYLRPQLGPGDEILITHMEHHSNIVPWQMVCEQTGAELKVAPINNRGEVLLDQFQGLLSERVKLVAMVHISNALGTVNPVQQMTAMAKEFDIPVLIDGAQAAPHQSIDVAAIGCDFYCLSGHKMYGPTGVGILWGNEALLEAMPPYQGGGEMIKRVTFESTIYNDLPGKFEAGTPNIAGGIGIGAAAAYLQSLGLDNIAAYEQELLTYGTEQLQRIQGLRMVGTAAQKAGVLAFAIDGIHPHDLGTIVDHQGVAIRTGHHCAMPVIQFFQLPATSRASLGLYNTRQEIDVLAAAIERARRMLV